MQPAPKPNDTQPIHEQVIEDIKRRAEVGKQNYGTYLQVGNGRDPLLDAYEEAQDKALYLKQAILERDQLVAHIEILKEALEKIMIGGNHLASALIHILDDCDENPFPPYETPMREARMLIADPIHMDLWTCWAVIMLQRDALEAIPGIRQSQEWRME